MKNLLPETAFSLLKSCLKNLESEINKDLQIAHYESMNMPFELKFKRLFGQKLPRLSFKIFE